MMGYYAEVIVIFSLGGSTMEDFYLTLIHSVLSTFSLIVFLLELGTQMNQYANKGSPQSL